MRTTLAMTIVSAFAATAAGQNLVVNGDFENNTAGSSQFNILNAQFTAFMANTAAFGTSEELDIVTGLDFGIAPQSGSWKVGMHQKEFTTDADAFSMDLSSPVVAGNNYSLRFYTVGEGDFGSLLGPVEVGLSNNPLDFGTQIFAGTALNTTSWTQFNFAFVAPVGGAYLTFRTSGSTPNMYSFLDNVSLVPAPAALLPLAGLFGLARRRTR